MKKIFLELCFTVVAVGALFVVGAVIKNGVYAAEVYRVSPETVKDTVVCSGKIQYKETKEIIPPSNGIVKEVYVSKGDIVSKDDVLFTMVTDISAIGNTSGALSEVLDKNTIKVTAPVSGTIFNIDVSPKSAVTNTATAATIVNSDDLCVNLPVSESKISDIAIGQNVEISGSAFKNKKYTGTVSDIDNSAQQVVTATGKETAVNVTIDIKNPDDNIKQGYTAKCAIVTDIKNNDFILPYEAVEMNSTTNGVVYKYTEGKAVKTSVKVGNEYENGIEVLSGIKENDLIINTPDKITNTENIKINKLMENSND